MADQATVDLEIRVADGDWQRLCEAKVEKSGEELGTIDTSQGAMTFSKVIASQTGVSCDVYIAHEPASEPRRISVVDDNGAMHPAGVIMTSGGAKAMLTHCEFAIPAERVTAVVVDTRPFEKTVVVKNVSIQSGKGSKPEVQLQEKK